MLSQCKEEQFFITYKLEKLFRNWFIKWAFFPIFANIIIQYIIKS